MINEAERFFRFQNKWDLLGEENISKGFDSNHVLGFLKSQKFTELLRKYTYVYWFVSTRIECLTNTAENGNFIPIQGFLYHESYIQKCSFQIYGLKYQKSTELKKLSNTEKFCA